MLLSFYICFDFENGGFMTKKQALKKLIQYYKPYKALFFSDMFFALISSISALAIPLIIRRLIKQIGAIKSSGNLPNNIIPELLMIPAILMIILILIEAGCNYFMGYYGHVMGAKIEKNMRSDIFSHYMKLSFAFYDNQKVGQLLSRITSDLFDITELLHHGPEDVCISIIKIIGAAIILFRINGILSAFLFIVVFLMLFFTVKMNNKMKVAFQANRKNLSIINGQIEDSLSGIRAVKSFTNENVELGKFETGNKFFLESKKQTYKTLGAFFSGITAFSSFINVGVLIIGGYLMISSNLTQTDLLTFILYIGTLLEPVRKLTNFTEMFQNGFSGYSRFIEILNIAPDIADKPNAISITDAKGDIEFKNVSFSYHDEGDAVLSNINLHLKSGEYVAIVGPSGAGKTTLCSLIPRFYEIDKGSILLDGHDIRDIKLNELRSQIGIVQQDVYIFAGTVAENIAYGKENATMEEIIAAAKAANAHDFIMEMPQGYASDIGKRGVKLSGGQKQRISIARVFLKNPSILILDEATSSLDNKSERIVQASFDSLSRNRTTLVIAHRLSTIKNAERILVCTQDGIVQDGTHKELIKQDGVYKNLHDLI